LANEYLLEFKCSNCDERSYEYVNQVVATTIPPTATRAEHYGYKVGVGNFPCGKMQLNAIWEKFR
jgi:hypothetical protein